jgi:hypothetical protein
VALRLERDAYAACAALDALPRLEYPVQMRGRAGGLKHISLALSSGGFEQIIPHRVRRTSRRKLSWGDLSAAFLTRDDTMCVSYARERDSVFTSPIAPQIVSHVNERLRLARAVERHKALGLARASITYRVSGKSTLRASIAAAAARSSEGSGARGCRGSGGAMRRGSKSQRFFGVSSHARLDVEVRKVRCTICICLF